jgi:hypothetical protein
MLKRRLPGEILCKTARIKIIRSEIRLIISCKGIPCSFDI